LVQNILGSIIEERKIKEENEIKERETRIALEKQKLENEAKEREMQLALEKVKLAQLDKEVELQRVRNERPNQNESSDSDNETISSLYSLENLIRSVRTLTIPIPEKAENFNLFFKTLERAFITKKVPDDLKAEILINLLGDKAKNILFYISEEDIKSYDTIKSLVLKEFQPTAQECLINFRKAKREINETHTQFVSRLSANFQYYCSLREVNDFESLCQLIISDKLFQTLDRETSSYINVKIGEGWLKPKELAKEIDIYFVNKGRSFGEVNSQGYDNTNRYPNYSKDSKYIPPQRRKPQILNDNNYASTSRQCYICASNLHLARTCPNKINRFDKINKQSENTNKKPRSNPYVTANKSNHIDEAVVTNVNSKHLKNFQKPEKINLFPLQRINICVAGKEIEAIIDSGTQISILNTSLIPDIEVEGKGKILLQSAFGKIVEAKLAVLPIYHKAPDTFLYSYTNSLFALTDKLNVACLITPDVYKTLTESPEVSHYDLECSPKSPYGEAPAKEKTKTKSLPADELKYEKQNSMTNSDGKPLQGISVEIDGSDCTMTDLCTSLSEEEKTKNLLVCANQEAASLGEEQQKCDTLKGIWAELKNGKGNFEEVDGLLFHKDKILGETVLQLVLPCTRREKVLMLAHKSVFGSHMGMKKTKERIRYNFFWPGMAKDIAEYCKTCEDCQLRRVNKVSDRAPITAVVRPSLPFEVVNIDIIGPIQPPSGRGHKYILCLMDQHTRWPEAIPLKSLSAKATCEALLCIFTRTGIPNIIASDCGTNFISSLTQEFMNRIGSSPRLSTPGYPASNGLVERWNGVLKNMLHQVIREDPSNWDRQLPYLLWAYREVPTCTTGLSPFRLMYGREAKGPLAILKSTWSGEVHIPTNITESAIEYLQRLKTNLEIAAEKASLIAAEKQKSYEDYFNRRSSCKKFEVGDQVILLIPDSSNKLYARWTGPGEVIERSSQYSYKVKLSDGSIRHVHVNKMRKYYPRSQTIGVIFEEDSDFGDIYVTPVKQNELNFLPVVDIQHLDAEKKKELTNLLCKHSKLFSGKIQIAKVGEHKIRLMEGTVRKKPCIYRIPETLKPKVDEQIKELERLNLIEPSEAEIAYPVVCVNKQDGSIRLCIDFRAFNVVTKKDDFPMENITDLINSIGGANVITSLDILKGYWEIPLEEKSRDLTSFKTHRAQYRWKVMPFGLKNAAATFQRVMNTALSDHKLLQSLY